MFRVVRTGSSRFFLPSSPLALASEPAEWDTVFLAPHVGLGGGKCAHCANPKTGVRKSAHRQFLRYLGQKRRKCADCEHCGHYTRMK